MKYKLELEFDEFKSRQIKKRADMKEILGEDVLKEQFETLVSAKLDEWILDELNDKIQTLSPGKALALLEAMNS